MPIILFDIPNSAVKDGGGLFPFHFMDEETEVQNI